MEGDVWEVVVQYFSGKESIIPPKRGTLALDELLLPVQDRQIPGSGLVLNCSCSKSIRLHKQLSHHKCTLIRGGLMQIFHPLISNEI